MRQTFLSIFVWRSFILQWKTVHAISMLFSTSLELGSGDCKKRKRLILLVSGRNLCLMFLHLTLLFYFHHQPAHSFLLFPFFKSVIHSFYLAPLTLLSPSHSECKATAWWNAELFWESKCHFTHITFSLFCHREGVGNFDLVPPTHTNTYTHCIWPHLIWHAGCPSAWALAHNAAPNVTAVQWH